MVIRYRGTLIWDNVMYRGISGAPNVFYSTDQIGAYISLMDQDVCQKYLVVWSANHMKGKCSICIAVNMKPNCMCLSYCMLN